MAAPEVCAEGVPGEEGEVVCVPTTLVVGVSVSDGLAVLKELTEGTVAVGCSLAAAEVLAEAVPTAEGVSALEAVALAVEAAEAESAAVAGTLALGCALDVALLLRAPLALPAALALAAPVAVPALVALVNAVADAVEEGEGSALDKVAAGEAVSREVSVAVPVSLVRLLGMGEDVEPVLGEAASVLVAVELAVTVGVPSLLGCAVAVPVTVLPALALAPAENDVLELPAGDCEAASLALAWLDCVAEPVALPCPDAVSSAVCAALTV